MHGSPMSKYDNRDLWNNEDYKKWGIIGEPYLDVNYEKDMFYLTDTGRCWDGNKYSVRDRVVQREGKNSMEFRFHSTDDIINALQARKFPNRVMITTHPQRWEDNLWFWYKELLLQSVKNLIKMYR